MMRTQTAALGAVFALAAGLLLARFVDFKRLSHDLGLPESAGRWSDEAWAPISSQDPAWGKRSAGATIVVFADMESPASAAANDSLRALLSEYGKDKLRVIWKHNILVHRATSRPVLVAAQTVHALGGNGAFWRFHDLAFAHQSELTRENFEAWGSMAGVQTGLLRRALDAGTFAWKVDADTALARQLNVETSPAMFLNCAVLPNAQPLARYREQIDAQLAKAAALKLAPDRLYSELCRLNREQPHAGAKSDTSAAPSAASSTQRATPPAQDTTVWKVPIQGAPVRGSRTAPVTIVVFGDYQCPFCRRTDEILVQLLREYGDKVRLVWRDRVQPFHPRSEPAAEFAREARRQKGDGGFWAAHDLLFAHNTRLEAPELDAYARELGIDVAQVRDAVAKRKYDTEIQTDLELAEQLSATTTPHLFINGRRLAGGQSPEQLKKMIDEQLAIASGLLAEGTPADKVYDKLMASAVAPPDPALPAKREIPAPGKDNPWKGAADAPVVVQLFSDFQCPYCRQEEDTVRALEKEYGRKLKIAWRNKPMSNHPDAALAAEAAMEAYAQKGNEGFWRLHDLLFDGQASPDGLKRPALEKYAAQVGLDLGRFKAALDSHTHKPVLDADLAAANAAGIDATPSLAVNGYVLAGAAPLHAVRKLVVHELRAPNEPRP